MAISCQTLLLIAQIEHKDLIFEKFSAQDRDVRLSQRLRLYPIVAFTRGCDHLDAKRLHSPDKLQRKLSGLITILVWQDIVVTWLLLLELAASLRI